MSFLIVGGVTVSVAVDGAKQTAEFLGEKTRMQDGTMRVLVVSSGYKRQWAITTTPMTDANAATLKAQLNTTTFPVACSGDLLGGSVNCIPTLTAYDPVNVRGQLYRRVSFTLDEA